ncbi:MAG TPA: hypothetical protein VER33_26000 [Polyangiaceae bacterium]|nr:hypothetical protein [Polyangiaceae bacterium]
MALPVAVCIELSQGPIVSALLEHDFFVFQRHGTEATERSAFGRKKGRCSLYVNF